MIKIKNFRTGETVRGYANPYSFPMSQKTLAKIAARAERVATNKARDFSAAVFSVGAL